MVGLARRSLGVGGFVVGDEPAGERRADGSVAVGDRALQLGLALLHGRDQLAEVVVLGLGERIRLKVLALLRFSASLREHVTKIKPRAVDRLQQVGAAACLGERLEPERGEHLAHLLGEEAEVALQVLGLAGELAAQLLLLGRDTDGAAV